MAINLKLPWIGQRLRPRRSPTAPVQEGLLRRLGRIQLPMIGAKPAGQQLQLLGLAFFILLSISTVFIVVAVRNANHSTAFVGSAGQLRTLSQQIAKSTPLALQGNAAAFKDLASARGRFAALLGALQNGGEVDGIDIPQSPAVAGPALNRTAGAWERTGKDAALMLEQQANLVSQRRAIVDINAKNPALLELAEEVAALKLASGAPSREISAANQLMMLTQRVAKNANTLLAVEGVPAEVAFSLGKDSNTFRDLLAALIRGNEPMRIGAAHDDDTRALLDQLDEIFKNQQASIAGILANLQRIVTAKEAGNRILADSPELLAATEQLFDVYSNVIAGSLLPTLLAVVFGALALAALALMVKVFNADTTRRQLEAEEQRRQAEAAKNASQEAILRLMNEMGDLADGNLTVRATVTEDITGAIADSVNYTVEELSVLVKRINDTAARVALASSAAQAISRELLAATERQSTEITAAGRAVLDMAHSMGEVSARALEAARVARQSLEAAGKGASAVDDSISGMNEIRNQIQETSKRIKRLGESSQEIGEIVELISDITEQTNVLALNAAIQAATAGEAGRGFSIVAEEVQKLAERSGEATKQIAAIVKTIQTDTQEAVLAMESSTRDVIEGAGLADAAGQALKEISIVSNNLAALIGNISSDTEQQAATAKRVAGATEEILRVTEQTSAGTRKTAVSIGQLASLADELKGSVAGFKV